MKLILILFAVAFLFELLLIISVLNMSAKCSKKEETIVFCKNCKHWDTENCSDGMGWCPKANGYRSEIWYCASGERKDGET
jgi:hypothetical protein